jgi:hypothetical protein
MHNAKRYSIVKEQCPHLRANPPRSGLVQQSLELIVFDNTKRNIIMHPIPNDTSKVTIK